MTKKFKKKNDDGTPMTCKFCHDKVWRNVAEGREYNTDGKTLHVMTCSTRTLYHGDQPKGGQS